MNKVFSIGGKVADEFKKNNFQFITNAKNAFISYFGKKREGLICSTLDYSDYVWLAGSALQNRLVGFRQAEIATSEFADYLRSNQTMTNFKQYVVGSIVKFISNKMFNTEVCATACAITRGLDNGRLDNFCILSVGLTNAEYVHELLHVMSTRMIKDEGEEQPMYVEKIGFHTCSDDRGKTFNEIFTDYLANQIDKDMKNKNLPLLGSAIDFEEKTQIYSNYFPLMAPLFKKYKKELINSYFDQDFSAIYKVIGKQNFDNLLNAFDELYVYDQEKEFRLKEIVNFMFKGQDIMAIANELSIADIEDYKNYVNAVILARDNCINAVCDTLSK